MLLTRYARNPERLVSRDKFWDLPKDLDRFFVGMLPPAVSATFPVDIREEGQSLVIEAELPGLSRDQLDITVENGMLTIAGEVKEVTEENEGRYHLRERRSGSFSRSFQLPDTADGEKVDASLKDGVLTLTIPTREEAKPRRIEVKQS